MRILLTNDDGIHAEGIHTLWRELSAIGEVIVAAPDRERSATSQAITVHHPIRVDRHRFDIPGVTGWKIGGTPADCVKLAVEALMDVRPDVVVSGINHGPNLGTDVLYSGTVSAAIEGALNGIPAVAFSLHGDQGTRDFGPTGRFARKLVASLADRKLPPNTLLNVNVPSLPDEEIKGVEVTRMGELRYENIFERREDPRGRAYYWMGGSLADFDNEDGTDVAAIKKGMISVTPIHFDLTNYAIMNLIKEWNLTT